VALQLAAAAASALALHFYSRVEAPGHWLGFVLLVPWLAALDRARGARGALGSALAMALCFALGVFAWFGSAIAGYADAPRWAGLAALLVLAPILQPQLFAFAWARHAAREGAAWRALAGACAYVGAEWALPKLFGDTIGHGLQSSAVLRQAADLAGAPGLTFALLVANEAVLAALRGARRAGPGFAARVRAAAAPAAGALAIVAALAGYGAWRLPALAPDPSAPPLVRAALVQADLSGYARMRHELGSYGAVRLILDEHFALSAGALARGPLDVVLWPETVYPTTFGAPKSEDGAALDAELAAFAAETGVSLGFGAYDAGAGAGLRKATPRLIVPPAIVVPEIEGHDEAA